MTPESVGGWLLAASALVIVIELAVMGVWSSRLARKARRLAVQLESDRALVRADVARLRLAIAETQLLWRPFGRALRWLRHPLVVALLASLQRRLAAR